MTGGVSSVKLLAAALMLATGTLGLLAMEIARVRTYTSFTSGVLFLVCWVQLIGGGILAVKSLFEPNK